ncbi:MAG: hypothetical protein Q6I77_04515 [Gloeomargarita sp. DG_1_4_bins_134]
MVIGIILLAATSMGQKAIGSRVAVGLARAGCIGSLTRVNPVLILGVAGFVGWMLKLTPQKGVPLPPRYSSRRLCRPYPITCR